MNSQRKLSLLLVAATLFGGPAYALEAATPSWYGSSEDCHGCIYTFGLSLPLQSEQEAIRNATLNAYQNLAIEHFGMGLHSLVRQETDNQSTSFQEGSTGLLRIQSVPSTVVSKAALSGSGGTYTGYVKVRFQNSDLDQERRNQKALAEAAFQKELATITSTQRIGHATPLAGSMLLQGVPVGAKVYLDNSLIGSGEAYFASVGSGDYKLLVTHDAFHSAEASISVAPGKRSVFQIELARKEGELLIDTQPPHALLSLDGVILGYSPLRKRLPAGEYSLIAEKDGVGTKQLRVLVKTDRLASYKLDLSRGRHPISIIVSQPIKFELWRMGPHGAERFGTYSLPKQLSDLQLPVGRYDYVMKRQGCEARSGNVTVDGKKPVTLDGRLECLPD